MITRAAAQKLNKTVNIEQISMSDEESVDGTRVVGNSEKKNSNTVYYDVENLPITDEAIEETLSQQPQVTPQIVSSLEEGLMRLTSHLEFLNHKLNKDGEVHNRRFAMLESLVSDKSPSQQPATLVHSSELKCPPSLCGKPQVFDGKNLENFLLLIENYSNMHKLENNQKLAVLVSYLGPAVTTYRSWCTSNIHGSYDELVAHLRIIYASQPNTLMAKVNFRNMKRRADQSFESFLTDLQEAALLAYHEQSFTTVNSAVIEQFLLGLQNTRVQEILMQEDYVNPVTLLQKAQKIRDSISVANNSGGDKQTRVNYVAPVRQNNIKRNELKCWNCGDPNHRALQCKRPSRQQIVCFACHKPGHKWSQCRALNHPSGNEKPGMRRDSPNPVLKK